MTSMGLNPNGLDSAISSAEEAIKQAKLNIPAFEPGNYFEHPGTPDVRELALREVRAGRDPLDCDEARRALDRRWLDQNFNHYEAAKQARLFDKRDHYLNHYDAMVDELLERFDTAVDTLHDVYKVLGNKDIKDVAPMPEHLVPIARAKEADHNAHAAIRSLAMIRGSLKPSSGGTKWECYSYMKPTLDQVVEHRLHRDPNLIPGVWDAIRFGIEVELATTRAEESKRHKAVEAEEARRKAAAIDN
ncbi:hypothetical protein ACU4IU_12590 [Brevibacterium sp. CSND-B09]|uniref:hypothetical protein n=1 Tax=Brevibacterium sp. CSND-B09 TaxID=3462571 RepID=UPI00406A6502